MDTCFVVDIMSFSLGKKKEGEILESHGDMINT